MGRNPKHPLNRYAKPTALQLKRCATLSPFLDSIESDSSIDALNHALRASGDFAFTTASGNAWAAGRGRDSATIQHLEWMNAMVQSLSVGGESKRTNKVTDAFRLGYYLHVVPDCLGQASILDEIRRSITIGITWEHLICLLNVINMHLDCQAVIIRPVEIARKQQRLAKAVIPFTHDPENEVYVPTTEVLLKDIVFNRTMCREFLRNAIELELSPAQFKKHVRDVVMTWRREAKAVLAANAQFDSHELLVGL